MEKKIYEMKKHTEITADFQFLVSQLEESRRRLLTLLKDVSDDMMDFTPDGSKIESIATLLDHIAAVEWSWIFEDIDGMKMDMEEWKFAFATREWADFTQREGKTLAYYVQKLEQVRKDIINRIGQMLDDDRLKIVGQENDKFSIEWILYHLNHHEAQHYGQISLLKRLAQLRME